MATMRTEKVTQIYSLPNGGDLMVMNPMVQKVNKHITLNKVFIWMFPKIVVHQNGWFIREHPIKMDDLGVPLFSETPICTIVNNGLYKGTKVMVQSQTKP